MAIETPYSLELGYNEDARDAIEFNGDADGDHVSGKIKMFLDVGVPTNKIQSVVGSARACFRHYMNEQGKTGNTTLNVLYGNWESASAGNIHLDFTAAELQPDDIFFTLANPLSSHKLDETFKQLINVFLERTKDN